MGNPVEVDVLVIGAGAAGWPAAIGAARAGARVMLLEEDAVPGGAAMDQYVLMLDGGPRSGVIVELCRALEHEYPLTAKPADRWWDFWYLPSDYLTVVTVRIAAPISGSVRRPMCAVTRCNSAPGSTSVSGWGMPRHLISGG